MRQGTTPTHYFDLDIGTEMIEAVRITYKQGDTLVLEKETKDCVMEEKTIAVTLTQEETLKFDHNTVCKVQIHCRTLGSQVLTSDPMVIGMVELLSGRIL